MRRFVCGLTILFAACFVAPSLHAQETSAVTGVVSDTTGAVVVGADVLLENTATSAQYHAKTNTLGSYTIVKVLPGQGYKLTVTMGGFEPAVVSDIYLTVATTRTQNAEMKPAGVKESVAVSAANAEVTLNTTDATIGNNLDVKLLDELPVQLRDTPVSLFNLQPGVADSSVTGARTDQSYVSVDGLDVNDISTGQTFLIVANAPIDSVEEFRGTVAGQLAAGGPGGGGQFELVTKSGTNSWHGNVNLYHRDTSTVANFWFNDEAGVPLAHLVRNQFGGNVGGPIKKDKAFFFVNFFDLRLAQATSVDRIVPTKSYMGGNISYILANPSSGTGSCSFTSRLNTTPQCIGTLTPAQVKSLDPANIGFSSVMQNFLNARYSAFAPNDPTNGDGVNTEGYRFNAPNPDDETNYVVRVDYTLNPSMKLFAKFGMIREDGIEFLQQLPSDPVAGNPIIDRSYNYVIGHTWTIGQNKVNQFSYGDTVEKFNFPATDKPTGTTVLTLGGVANNTFLGDPYPTQESQKRRLPIPVVRDDFNWLKGAHNFGFGGSFKFIKTESQQINDFNFLSLGLGPTLPALSASVRPTVANGYVTNSIRGGSTAPFLYDNAFASALGHVAAVSTNYNYNNAGAAFANGTGHVRQYRYYQTELYFGDTWKVNRALTLSYGVNYQYYSVPYETNGLESVQNFDFDTYFGDRIKQSAAGISGPTTLPFIVYNLGGKANNAAPLFQPNRKDFAPRLSFAYNPSYLPKTVFNGSAGIVYDRTVLNALNFVQDQSSYLFQNSVETDYGDLTNDPRTGTNFSFPGNTAPAITHPYTPFVSGGAPYGIGELSSFNTVIDPHLKDPYSIALNAGVQQQLPWDMVLKLSYVGRMGRRLLAQADASQLIDFPDTSSGQLMSTAFANMTKAARAGQTTVAPQAWFEDQVGAGFTQFIYGYSGTANYIYNGDFADFIQFISGLLDYNVGMASQFASNAYFTNKGSSSYNGLLATLSKNTSHGLQFTFNYTWSHSIDNTSLVANKLASSNGVGFICDVVRPRDCRGNSDFDETHVINGDFSYQLPIGRHRTFAGDAPRWLDEVIGGWNVSGITQWHSGVAFSAFSNAFVAGFANNAPAIFNGDRGAIRQKVNKDSSGAVNLFANPSAALNAYSGPVGFNIGSRNNLRGPSSFRLDAGLAKSFPLIEDHLNLKFRADAFNVLNHPTFAVPDSDGTDITEFNGVPFGQITSTSTDPRVVQLAVRVEF